MSAFTPGQWRVYTEDHHPNGTAVFTSIQADDGQICCMSRLPGKEDSANAHLIAAAPELYEALVIARQYVMGRCDQLQPDSEAGKLVNIELAVVNSAIAKAEGKP